MATTAQLIARKDIDAVMIAAQDHWHALIATAAAAAGKDMYCEKPMGISVEEGQKILRAVRKHKRVFQAGTWQRSQGKFRQACALVRNGYVGKLREIQVSAPGPQYQPKYDGSLDPQPVPAGFDWEMWRGPAPAKPYNPGRVAWPDWYLIWDYCAGFICNWGVHYLDIAYWGCPALAKEPCEIECQGVYRKKGFTDNIESWNATFTFASGLKMVFTDVTSEQKQKTGTRFIGDKGWVHVNRAGIWAEPESLLQVTLKPGETTCMRLRAGRGCRARQEGDRRSGRLQDRSTTARISWTASAAARTPSRTWTRRMWRPISASSPRSRRGWRPS